MISTETRRVVTYISKKDALALAVIARERGMTIAALLRTLVRQVVKKEGTR